MNRFTWFVFAIFAIGVGLYPLAYFLTDARIGILNSKTEELLADPVWTWAFYQHITMGGLALVTGWSQFIKRIRTMRLNFHRNLGKFYVVVSLLGGMAGLYLSFFATGGTIAKVGFGCLAIGSLFSTTRAYLAIRRRKVDEHQAWMIRSYAFTFAAVTLRIWLPLSMVAQMDFIEAYKIIAWLCWVPNIILAEWLVRRLKLPALAFAR